VDPIEPLGQSFDRSARVGVAHSDTLPTPTSTPLTDPGLRPKPGSVVGAPDWWEPVQVIHLKRLKPASPTRPWIQTAVVFQGSVDRCLTWWARHKRRTGRRASTPRVWIEDRAQPAVLTTRAGVPAPAPARPSHLEIPHDDPIRTFRPLGSYARAHRDPHVRSA